MTSDDQHFLDILASAHRDFREYTKDMPFADAINQQFESAGESLRHSLESATWLPDFARPRPPKPPPRLLRSPVTDPRGFIGATWQRLVDYRVVVCPMVAFFGTGAFLYYRRRRLYAKKRRAKRTTRGIRTELVVVAGDSHSALTRSTILDLERRGFVVYVVASNTSEEAVVKDEGKHDILALHLNVADPVDVDNTIKHFGRLLREPQHAHPGSEPHQMTFAGLVLIPDITYPAGPVETISLELWSDALNAKVLGTIATAQAFLRLLAEFRSRLIIATPSIIPLIRPPFQSVESTVVGALDNFTYTLRSEMATLGVPVCQLHLGSFDLSSGGSQQPLSRNAEQEVLFWPSHARSAYAQNYLKQEGGWSSSKGIVHTFGRGSRNRGSPLRELNNAVFDCLTVSRPRSVQRVGQGSTLYATIGAVAPASLVRWMMGIRPIQCLDESKRSPCDSPGWEKV